MNTKLNHVAIFAVVAIAGGVSSNQVIAVDDGQYWALLIGVEDYEHATPLQYVSNDVLEISDALIHRANFHSDNLTMIYDGAERGDMKPTRQNVLREVKEFLKKPQENDQVIVYFSGHGKVDKETKSLFLAPKDCIDQRLAETAVPAEWLRKQLAQCKSESKFLIIDACHAGTEKGDDPGEDARSDELGEVFRGLKGVATLASSTGEQKSLIWARKKQSLFSYWLTQALKGHADKNRDGMISFDETYAYVYGQVRLTAKVRLGREQDPVRVVRTGTLGDPIIAQLKPQSLDRILADMAEQIAWTVALERLGTVGVLEFTGKSNNVELIGGDFGMLGSYCADKLNNQLLLLGKGEFSVVDKNRIEEAIKVVDSKTLHKALADTRFDVDDLGKTKSLQDLAEKVGEMPVLVRGTLFNREGALINLRAELVQTGNNNQHASVGGLAFLTESEWAMLGLSAVIKPEDRIPDKPDKKQKPSAPVQPASHSVIRRMDEDAEDSKQEHPNRRADFPFRVWIQVDGKRREMIKKGNELVVPLSPGEVYTVKVDYLNRGENSSRPVAMRLLVDGLNTLAERADEKGIETWEWAKRMNLDDARHWVLDPQKHRKFHISGFYGKDNKYREFTVVGSQDSLAARQNFADSIGLITAAFYSCGGNRKALGGNPSDVGTAAGIERDSKLRVNDECGVGKLLGVINIRYASPEALQ